MSAGRRDWIVTSEQHIDANTSLVLRVELEAMRYHWTITRPGYSGTVAQGVEASMSAAKGAAGKALDAAKEVK